MYVVGATKASHLEKVRKLIPDSFLLIPGVVLKDLHQTPEKTSNSLTKIIIDGIKMEKS